MEKNKDYTGREFLEFLAENFNVTWWKGAVASPPNEIAYPPMDIWRANEIGDFRHLVGLLSNLVSSYRGYTIWILEKKGRNWVLAPRSLIEASGKDVTLLSIDRPDEVRRLIRDYVCLIAYVAESWKRISKETKGSGEDGTPSRDA